MKNNFKVGDIVRLNDEYYRYSKQCGGDYPYPTNFKKKILSFEKTLHRGAMAILEGFISINIHYLEKVIDENNSN